MTTPVLNNFIMLSKKSIIFPEEILSNLVKIKICNVH